MLGQRGITVGQSEGPLDLHIYVVRDLTPESDRFASQALAPLLNGDSFGPPHVKFQSLFGQVRASTFIDSQS